MPAYWLGAFFNPRGLLALLKQEAIKNYCGDRSGNFEQFTFQTDTTFRDFGHVSTFDLYESTTSALENEWTICILRSFYNSSCFNKRDS